MSLVVKPQNSGNWLGKFIFFIIFLAIVGGFLWVFVIKDNTSRWGFGSSEEDDSCKTNEYRDENKSCVVCNGVLKDNTCTHCESNQIVVNNTCTDCESNQIVVNNICTTCESNQVIVDGICTTCESNQVIVDGICTTCDSNQVVVDNTCTDCEADELVINFVCAENPCNTNEYLDFNDYTCKECDTDETLVDNECISTSCPSGESPGVCFSLETPTPDTPDTPDTPEPETCKSEIECKIHDYVLVFGIYIGTVSWGAYPQSSNLDYGLMISVTDDIVIDITNPYYDSSVTLYSTGVTCWDDDGLQRCEQTLSGTFEYEPMQKPAGTTYNMGNGSPLRSGWHYWNDKDSFLTYVGNIEESGKIYELYGVDRDSIEHFYLKIKQNWNAPCHFDTCYPYTDTNLKFTERRRYKFDNWNDFNDRQNASTNFTSNAIDPQPDGNMTEDEIEADDVLKYNYSVSTSVQSGKVELVLVSIEDS